MTEYLDHQISLLSITPDLRATLHYLLGNIDDKGYLVLDSTHALTELYIDDNQLNESITILQSVDPPGVGARDLRECLLLQIKSLNSLAYKIVNDHLELL